jgi:hypothetical protein
VAGDIKLSVTRIFIFGTFVHRKPLKVTIVSDAISPVFDSTVCSQALRVTRTALARDQNEYKLAQSSKSLVSQRQIEHTDALSGESPKDAE